MVFSCATVHTFYKWLEGWIAAAVLPSRRQRRIVTIPALAMDPAKSLSPTPVPVPAVNLYEVLLELQKRMPNALAIGVAVDGSDISDKAAQVANRQVADNAA